MDWTLEAVSLAGFLESSCLDVENRGLCIPSKTLSLPHTHLTEYDTRIHRSFENGELDTNLSIDYIIQCEERDQITEKDSAVVHDVDVLCDELSRRVSDKFSLEHSNLVDHTNSKPVALNEDKYAFEEIFKSLTKDVVRSLNLTAEACQQTLYKCDYLDADTKSLLFKRLQSSEPSKSYAVQVDTSDTLPEFNKLVKDPAYTWPFELDTFQKQAILCLERNQSVFVAAHTSAGKTVVAEYASAMCRRRGSRVIYTSPIKALSNQKFHDFRQTFGQDVGLLTGDIKVSTDASLLIMTTEILHNMLCNAADAIRDLEVVIMDEVHYLNDAERGHVWEQIMIMLPKHVLLVMLSATVPNTMEFADWLGRIRGTDIHVVSTSRRPVPLNHYLFTGLDGKELEKHLHLVVDQNSQFNLPGYKHALTAFNSPLLKKPPAERTTPRDTSRADELMAAGRGRGRGGGGGGGGAGGRGGGGGGGKQNQPTGGKFTTPGRWNFMPSSGGMSVHEKRTKTMWLGVVRLLQEKALMPAIAFGFSRNSLEVLAEHMSSVDLLSHEEKNEVEQFLRFSIRNRLKGADTRLPSVLFISDLARRGLGVHHAGMLPLLKETVEMLFQRGLIRLLFATETFAMGVNMPARCVLFSTLEKFDGRKRRPLNPGEYTQMAGRAGRRGLDASGTVIIVTHGVGQSVASAKLGVPSQATLAGMILGTPTRLMSQFKITYSMILHLHRTNWLSPQDIMRRSFMEAPALRREMERRTCLSQLRSRISNTTISVPSAGSSAGPAHTPWFSKIAGVVQDTQPTNAAPFAIGEPMLQVRCPGQPEQLMSCVDSMATYYQACCTFRHLRSSVATILNTQSMNDLQRVFCPGRVIFVQLPPVAGKKGAHVTTSKSSKTGDGGSAERLPNWLVPAMVVDVIKSSTEFGSSLQCTVITWQPPDTVSNDLHVNHHTPLTQDSTTAATPPKPSLIDEDEEFEETNLREGEDAWMRPTPFPPQLMPLFIPSVDDALSRLTLLTIQCSRDLVRVCDHVIPFERNRSSSNSNVLVDQLTRAIEQHRKELTANEAGHRLVRGANTAAGDPQLPELMVTTNESLLEVSLPFIDSQNAIRTSVHGLLPDFPPTLRLDKAFRWKSAGVDDPVTLLNHYYRLAEELTTPLTYTDCPNPRLAPLSCLCIVEHVARVHRTCRRRWAVKRLEASLSDDKLHLNCEYLGRLRVLEELGFIDAATERGCLSLKGRVACELQQMEVLLTQLLLDGSFTKLPPADITALLSCFVFELKASDVARDAERDAQSAGKAAEPTGHLVVLDTVTENPAPATTEVTAEVSVESGISAKQLANVPEHLQPSVVKMFECAEKLHQLQTKHGLLEPSADTRLNCALVQATYAWACGNPFSTLVTLTSMPEGNLVRGLLRLDELLRHICNAIHRLGDQALGLRMNEARQLIHRDLICAPSLYISEDFVRPTSQSNET